mgnify:CR=1 FL=1
MDAAITTFANRDALMEAAANGLARTLQKAIDATGSGCAALSGGSTPEPAYAALAKRHLDWSRVTFALVDERFVPPTHQASNEAMLRRALAPALAAGARLAPMYSEAPSLEAAAAAADALYAPLRIDSALMGMGADGHTASWFPGAPGLKDALGRANPHTVIAQRAPGATGSADRLTLTRAAISQAGSVTLLITGADHRAALEAALVGDDKPVAALFEPGMPKPAVLWAA